MHLTQAFHVSRVQCELVRDELGVLRLGKALERGEPVQGRLAVRRTPRNGFRFHQPRFQCEPFTQVPAASDRDLGRHDALEVFGRCLGECSTGTCASPLIHCLILSCPPLSQCRRGKSWEGPCNAVKGSGSSLEVSSFLALCTGTIGECTAQNADWRKFGSQRKEFTMFTAL